MSNLAPSKVITSITTHLRSLHWLPVKVGSTYKITCEISKHNSKLSMSQTYSHLSILSLREKGLKFVCAGKNHIVDQIGLLVLIRLPLGLGKCGHQHLLGILPDSKHWVFSLHMHHFLGYLFRTTQFINFLQCEISSFHALPYLCGPLLTYTPTKNLLFLPDNRILSIPYMRRKTFGHCSSPMQLPQYGIHTELRHIDSTLTHESALKTDLCKVLCVMC